MSDWPTRAACKNKPASWFFPPLGETHAAAKAVCAGCAVSAECLTFALENHEQHGVWGGLTPGERQRVSDGAILRKTHCEYCALPFMFWWEQGRAPVFCSDRCRREAQLRSHRRSKAKAG